jgi:hypothetical protein
MDSLLFYAGAIVAIIGGLWLLIMAFQTSIAWGIACLLLPFVSLIFVITHWDEAKPAFLTSLGGMGLIFLAGTFSA